ncbi:MAG: TlpA family protein disulfide reductase [Desulfobacterales bacterium]
MFLKALRLLLFGFAVLACVLPAWSAELPAKGDTLPAFSLPAPASSGDLEYLGVSGTTLTLADVSGDLVLLEILGVYCPVCREQAPLFNALQKRLERRELKGRVKMLGIAAGATDIEVEMIRKEWRIRHPVLVDQKFEVHKLLGEPKTPFTMLIDRQGRVLYTHHGLIQDMDAFYQQIKSLLD